MTSLVHVIYFNLQKRKVYTVLYNNRKQLSGLPIMQMQVQQRPLVHDANLKPLWSHVRNQLPLFLQDTRTSSTPFPSPLSFQPHMPTHVTQFQQWKTTSAHWKSSPSSTAPLKGQYHQNFRLHIFHKTTSPRPRYV